jgi:nitrate reductase gamma subunit
MVALAFSVVAAAFSIMRLWDLRRAPSSHKAKSCLIDAIVFLLLACIFGAALDAAGAP